MIKETKKEYTPAQPAYYKDTESCYCDSCKRLIYRKIFESPDAMGSFGHATSNHETAHFYHILGLSGENMHVCLSQNCLIKAIKSFGDDEAISIQIKPESTRCSEMGSESPDANEFDALREAIDEMNVQSPIISRLLDTIKVQNRNIEQANDDVDNLLKISKKLVKSSDDPELSFEKHSEYHKRISKRRNLVNDIKHIIQ